MFLNYIKITLRMLQKNGGFSFINIAGLAIGISVCLLILQYVSFEFSYDRFHKDANDIYRVANDRYQNGKLIQHGTITYSAIGKAMNDDYDEVIDNARFVPSGDHMIDVDGEKTPLESQAAYVDDGFLSVFSFPLLAGDKNTVMRESHQVALSETLARQIFRYGGSDLNSLLNKSFILDNEARPYAVKGVFKDIPATSHLKFQMLISYPTLVIGYSQAEYDFTSSDFWHYVKLKPGTDAAALQSRFDEFSARHFQGNKVSGSDEKFSLQPLTRAHLYSDYEYEIGETGKASVVWGLLIIAVFILVIAWINYVNLATARAMERAKEVGLRKATGAKKSQLIVQFLTESFVVNMIALLFAVIIIQLLQPSFNTLLEKDLSFMLLLGQGFGGYLTTIVLVATLFTGTMLSGFYPAFVLSSFRPVAVLKGHFGTSQKGILTRKTLVVAQFAATVILISGSIVVYQQIRFMNTKDLGLNIDQVLVVRPPLLTQWDSTFIGRIENFKEELKAIPGIKAAATSQRLPGNELARSFNVRKAGTDDSFTTRRTGIDADFIDLFNVRVVAGRKFVTSDFNPDFNALHSTIINEHAVKLLGFSNAEDAIGKQITVWKKTWNIVGVVGDYHQKSLRNPLEPIVFQPLYGTGSPVSIKVEAGNIAATIDRIKQKYQAFFPGNYFDYYFLDDRFNQQYRDDQLFGKVFGLFTGLAIFIACLGLLGLSAFIARLHAKEIGIRKVLGATVSNIVGLLSVGFIRLVIIAIVLASPLAWWIIDKWLQDFAYRINIQWWVFPATGAVAILIAMLTISFQSIKAAIANPVKTLRSE
jgi:putative ABC transport system permease protein